MTMIDNNIKTISKNESGVSFEEKIQGSKFISQIFRVDSVEDAKELLEDVRKRYYDATHNCYAYKVGDVEKASDDGEPSKTAGYQILNVIKAENMTNVLIVVTRYFGGKLLGTGGLSRAYSNGAKSVLEKCNKVYLKEGYNVTTKIPYEMQEELDNHLKRNNIIVVSREYLDKIVYNIMIEKDNLDEYIMFLENLTNSKLDNDIYNMASECFIETKIK